VNIIFIICDALRSDRLGCYGYNKPISPNIDKIASRGALFQNTFSTTNVTDVSLTTIFTGKCPSVHGLRGHGSEITEEQKCFIDNVLFLPEILHENGYLTVAIDWLGRWHRIGYDFYANKKNYLTNRDNIEHTNIRQKKNVTESILNCISKIDCLPNKSSLFYQFPFKMRKIIHAISEHTNGVLKRDFSRKKRPILSDSTALTNLALKYINNYAKKKRLFLFIHFWDNHIPYTAPKAMVKKFLRKHDYSSEHATSILNKLGDTKAAELIHKSTRGKIAKTVGEIRAHYDASVRYVDWNIGRIYKALKQLGLEEDTLFIVSSDHGESLGEHEIYFDHHGLYEPQVKVPLIINHPVFRPDSRYNEMTQHDNIVPTILDIAQIKARGVKFTGKSLLKCAKGQPWNRKIIFCEESASQQKRMIRDCRYKYIQTMNDQKCRYCQVYHSKTDEFYDLYNDPKELNNIIDNPKSLEYLKKMENFFNLLPKPKPGKITNFSDEFIVNEKLKSLGYF
jgi:arylsulfatase A-like enzyme